LSDITETARPVYGPGSEHNYFIDRLLAAEADVPMVRGLVGRDDLTPDEARMRLAQAAGAADAERRNNANVQLSVAHGGGDFNLSAASHINSAFTDSYVNEIVVEPLFTREDLPAGVGDKLTIPRITTGATVGVAGLDGASTPTQANPVSAAVSVPVGMVSGMLTVSRQFLDLVMAPGGEAIAARILGGRYAEAVDSQLWGGSAATGQTQGIATTTGATAGAYTDATPTVQEFVTAALKLRSVTATARKARLDTVVMHPRRASWYFEGNASTDVGFNALERAGLAIVEYTGVTTTDGVGTNQDQVLVCRKADLAYWASAPELIVAEEYSGLTNGQVAVAVKGYVASPGGLLTPAGIGLLTGTGLIAPSGF
jgi:hypothetical protein